MSCAPLLDDHKNFTYHTDVYQLRLFGILLRPSPLSFTVTTGAVVLFLGVSNWSYVTHSPLLQDYFFGRYGITVALQQSNISILDASIFYQTYTYDLVILLVAVLAGMLIYVVLEGFSHGLADARETINEIEQSQKASRHSIEIELLVRWSVRIIGLILWTIYAIFFVNVLLPFCILTARTGASDITAWPGWLNSLLGFTVLWLGCHQNIVFARLCALRPRLFGSRILEAELYKR